MTTSRLGMALTIFIILLAAGAVHAFVTGDLWLLRAFVIGALVGLLFAQVSPRYARAAPRARRRLLIGAAALVAGLIGLFVAAFVMSPPATLLDWFAWILVMALPLFLGSWLIRAWRALPRTGGEP